MDYYLAIDIGASSGRHIIGYKNSENNVEAIEVYRFYNGVEELNDHLVWNVDRLFDEVKKGIKIALEKYPNIKSMSIDTWGVDYVLLNNDETIYPVYAYRDSRCKDIICEVHSIIPFNTLFSITGSQFQEFNTIYQLYYDKINNRLDNATDFLYIPEYLMYRLTGVKSHEYTNASTSGMMDAYKNIYSDEIINNLGLKKELFKPLSKPGSFVGDFTLDVQNEVGGNIAVVLCATHDTASAVEGIPMTDNAPYISSGTWSLLGIKVDNAITTASARLANYSNEYGPDYIRFQKNIMGLWIIQCLSKEMNLEIPVMVEMAQKSNYFELYDVNDSVFLSNKNMKQEIIDWFTNRNIRAPKTDGDVINATYRSLAYSYKRALYELESITNKSFNYLYIVGGGAKNNYLNKLTEEFTFKKVIALPIEATAIGNLLSQIKER